MNQSSLYNLLILGYIGISEIVTIYFHDSIMLSKATGNPIAIERTEVSLNAGIIEAWYNTLED